MMASSSAKDERLEDVTLDTAQRVSSGKSSHYSCTLLQEGTIIISAGEFHSDLADEHGRRGLAFVVSSKVMLSQENIGPLERDGVKLVTEILSEGMNRLLEKIISSAGQKLEFGTDQINILLASEVERTTKQLRLIRSIVLRGDTFDKIQSENAAETAPPSTNEVQKEKNPKPEEGGNLILPNMERVSNNTRKSHFPHVVEVSVIVIASLFLAAVFLHSIFP